MNWYKKAKKHLNPRERNIPDSSLPYVDRVLELHRQGLSPYRISKALNGEISREKIYTILRIHGLAKEMTRNSLAPKEEIEERKRQVEIRNQQIVQMYTPPPKGQGMQINQIAQALGIAHMTVKKALEESGVFDEYGSWVDPRSENMLEWWGDQPGGFQGWLSKFPIDKQEEIQKAIGARRGDG